MGHIKRVEGFSCDVKKRRTLKHQKARCLFIAALAQNSEDLVLQLLLSGSVIPSKGCSVFHRKPRNVELFAWAEVRGRGLQHSSCRIPRRVQVLLRAELIPPTRYLSVYRHQLWLDLFPQIRLICTARFYFTFTPGISSRVSEWSSLTLCC